MTRPIAIRPARPADARALAALRHAFRGGWAPAKETEAAFMRRCTAWMRRALGDRRRWRCWVAVAREDDAIVGHVWVQVIDKVPNPGGVEAERHAYLTNFYVRPDIRGGGVGQRLLSAALTWCEARRVDSIFLWATADSRSLYARNGFAVSDALLEIRSTERRPRRHPSGDGPGAAASGRSGSGRRGC